MKKLLIIVCTVLCLFTSISANSNIWLDMSKKQLSVSEVIEQCVTFYNMPDGSDLLLTRTVEDNIGMTHYTYQQYIDGIKVEGCYLLFHTKNGIVSTINGRLLEVENAPNDRSYMPRKQVRVKNNLPTECNLEPLIFEHMGVYRAAYKYYDSERFANIYVDAKTGEEIVAVPTVNAADTQGSATTIYNGTKPITCNSYSNHYTLQDNARNIYTVDATLYDGQGNNSLYDWVNSTTTWNKPILSSITIEWAAEDWWYNTLTDTKPDLYIQITSGGTVLYTSGHFDDTDLPVTFVILPSIVEADGNLKVEVLDYDPLGDDSAGKVSVTKTTAGTFSWNNSKTRASYTLINNPAHDAHWGMEKVYDFYLQKFNHNSFDGNGTEILQLVNPPSTLSPYSNLNFPYNAAAIQVGSNCWMAYGLGDGIEYNPVVMIDVMGHEFTHLVTAANGDQNLPNHGEGGALNESFGDIMGNAVEAYALGSADWIVAKGIMMADVSKGVRSMKSPKDYKNPSTYFIGDYWQTITGNPTRDNDQDGVHNNCGVQNYWFYLLCQGGSGYIDGKQANGSYSVTGIGMDKAIQIVYRNLLTYITSTSKYIDSRNGSIQAAIDLYGRDSQEHQSVMNAWHAVGVGDKYVAPTEEFQLTPGKYVIVSNRDKAGDKNWYYMTSDLGTASTKRFQAVSTETENFEDIVVTELEDKYVWTLETDGDNWKLKNGTQYVTWTSGNSANLGSTAKSLTFDIAENMVLAHFTDGSAERYLSLNATTNNNYFAFYSGTNQVEQLYFLPYDDGSTPVDPQPESDRYVVLAQRNASSNWFYMTSDLGTASNKRYLAVDAGTSTLSEVTTTNLDDKYYWEIEENKLKAGTQYSTWTSGNTANLDATGKELTIQQQTDGTYTFSFVDGADTRYLALNATAGNDYFAYYKGTNQIYRLTLVKEGGNGSTVGVENIVEQPSATKVLMNGQILILRGDKTYTLTGQEVK